MASASPTSHSASKDKNSLRRIGARWDAHAGIDQDARPFALEPKVHPLEPLLFQRLRDGGLACRFAIEHQKSATAGARHLATQRAPSSSQLVAFVDQWIGNAGGELFLALPTAIQQLSEF